MGFKMTTRPSKRCPFGDCSWCQGEGCELYLKSDDIDVPGACTLSVIGRSIDSIANSLRIIVDLKTRAY